MEVGKAAKWGAKKVGRGALIAGKWLTPVGLIQFHVKRLKTERYHEDAFDDQERPVIVAAFTKSASGLIVSLLFLGTALYLYLSGIGTGGIASIIAIVLAIAGVISGFGHIHNLRLLWPRYREKEEVETTPLEQDPNRQDYLYRAYISQYFFVMLAVYFLSLWWTQGTFTTLLSNLHRINSMTLYCMAIGTLFLGVRAVIARRDIGTLRATRTRFDKRGYANISENHHLLYTHAFIAAVLFALTQVLLDYAIETHGRALPALIAKLACAAYTLLLAWGIAKTHLHFTLFTSEDKAPSLDQSTLLGQLVTFVRQLIVVCTGGAFKLPPPPESYTPRSPVMPAAAAIVIFALAIIIPKNWVQIVAYASLLLLSATLLAIAKVRSEMNEQ